jgi:hypothetical protein
MTQDAQRDPARDIGDKGLTPIMTPEPTTSGSTTGNRMREVPAKKTKAPRQVPPGAIVPDRGWPKVKYWLWKSRMLPEKHFPQINAKQRAELDYMAMLDYKTRLIERLRWLANMGITPILLFANNKSAGKSTAAMGVGNTIKWYTQKSTIAMPATANTATASIGEMSGIEGNLISVSEFARDLKKYDTTVAIEKRLPLTKWGLGVLVEDDNSAADEDDAEYTKSFMDSVDVIRPKFSVIILDGGNDNNTKRSLALQAARLSHVVNFVYMATSDSVITVGKLRGTVSGLWKDPGITEDIRAEYYDGFESKADTGIDIPTRHKIERSIVIATKAGPETLVDFDAVMRAKQDASADNLPRWGGSVGGTGIKVPADPSIGRGDGEGNFVPFDLFALSEQTQISYLEIAVANFEVAGWQIGVNIGTPMIANLPGSARRRREIDNFTTSVDS